MQYLLLHFLIVHWFLLGPETETFETLLLAYLSFISAEVFIVLSIPPNSTADMNRFR